MLTTPPPCSSTTASHQPFITFSSGHTVSGKSVLRQYYWTDWKQSTCYMPRWERQQGLEFTSPEKLQISFHPQMLKSPDLIYGWGKLSWIPTCPAVVGKSPAFAAVTHLLLLKFQVKPSWEISSHSSQPQRSPAIICFILCVCHYRQTSWRPTQTLE